MSRLRGLELRPSRHYLRLGLGLPNLKQVRLSCATKLGRSKSSLSRCAVVGFTTALGMAQISEFALIDSWQ